MAYTAFDRFVARCRFRAVLPHIRQGSRVCDVGCGPGAPLLVFLGERIRFGLGLDRHVGKRVHENVHIVAAGRSAGAQRGG